MPDEALHKTLRNHAMGSLTPYLTGAHDTAQTVGRSTKLATCTAAQRPVEVIVMWLNVPPTAIVAVNLTLALLNKTTNLPFYSARVTKPGDQNRLTWTAFGSCQALPHNAGTGSIEPR
ncbi:MAG TPA: hypothetical protein ENK06_13150 [Gammaproteobacteria bacterium]|nr:hypothetical protein [Gammaproteobacteria bacterium]